MGSILHQFYYFVGITNNNTRDIHLLRQDYVHIPNVQLSSKLLFHRVFVIDDAVQRLKQLHDKGVVEFLVSVDLMKLIYHKNKQRNTKNGETQLTKILQLRCSTTCVNKYNYVQPRSDTTPLYHASVTNPLYQGGVLLHKLYSGNEELYPSTSLSSNDKKFGFISDIFPTLTASQILLLFSIKGVRLLTVPRHILSPHCAYLIASPIYKANVPFPIFVQPRCDTILLYHISVTNPLYQGGVLLNKFYGKILSYHMNILWY